MTVETWRKLSVSEQLIDVGTEVGRAVDAKERGNSEAARIYLNKALKWLHVTEDDPKNLKRFEELMSVEYELMDYFYGLNRFNNDKDSIMSYWNSFLSFQNWTPAEKLHE